MSTATQNRNQSYREVESSSLKQRQNEKILQCLRLNPNGLIPIEIAQMTGIDKSDVRARLSEMAHATFDREVEEAGVRTNKITNKPNTVYKYLAVGQTNLFK